MLYALVVVLAVAHFYFQERNKRKVDSQLHIQGRTEEAEHFDFALTLFTDESEGQKQEKILKACEMIEARRRYNNERMERAYEEARIAAVHAKAESMGIPTKVDPSPKAG